MIPTRFVPPRHDWSAPGGDYVVKPSDSGSAASTGRFRGTGTADPAALVGRLHAEGRAVMVQPYLPGRRPKARRTWFISAGRTRT